jgi:hypothetical protein
MPEPIFMKHLNGVLHTSLPLICGSVWVTLPSFLGEGSVKCITPFVARQRLSKVYPLFVGRQRLGKHAPAATITSNNSRIVGSVCLRVCLCIPLSLLGNNLVKTFPRQRRFAGDVVFYAAHIVSKESRRLVLPTTFCFKYQANSNKTKISKGG